jgi:hypothetical protein
MWGVDSDELLEADAELGEEASSTASGRDVFSGPEPAAPPAQQEGEPPGPPTAVSQAGEGSPGGDAFT